ncbi:hypothetical protein [Mammaliicoccus sciuri]|uniref:hypothetical protein n=1 Tax=Mammaliicoccus sciuri TaxID=1296 RepID=UPI0021CE1675|nr:hypothetical protein [Mammaliicoccus sciuri]UXU70148.1 hypothetical protein MUA36_05565 [Mammaliicoccus sciuri]
MNSNKFNHKEFLEIQELFNDYIQNHNKFYLESDIHNNHEWSINELLDNNTQHLIETTKEYASGQDFKVYKQDNKYHFVKNDVEDLQACEHLILDNFDDLTTEIYVTLDNALESIGYYIDYEDDWNNIA